PICFVGALARALNVERLRLAPGLRAPPRSWNPSPRSSPAFSDRLLERRLALWLVLLGQSRRSRGNQSAAAPASATRPRPLAPRARLTPKSDAIAPIWSWPSGAIPIAATH